jgi:hypothetical protein
LSSDDRHRARRAVAGVVSEVAGDPSDGAGRLVRNVLAERFERLQLVKGNDLSPLSTYVGDGMAPLYDLPAGEGLWLVPIVRGDALDDALEPMPVDLPVPATMAAKP